MTNPYGYGVTRAKDNTGTWKPLRGLYMNQNGTWSPVQKAFIKNNGTWEQVYPTPTAIVSVTPATLIFNDVYTTLTGTAQTVTISNSGTNDLWINNAVITSNTNFTTLATFNGFTNGNIIVAPGHSATVSLNILGVVQGANTASLSFSSNVGLLGTSTVTVPISGTIILLYAQAVLSATSVTLTSDTNATANPSQSIRIDNTGNGPLNISSIVTSGVVSLSGIPGTIAAGSSATFTVQYTNTGTAGLKKDNIVITSNSITGGKLTIPVTVNEIDHGTLTLSNAGTYNWTVPYGITSVAVSVAGGGGGGAGAGGDEEPTNGGGGGGGGAVVTKTVTVSPAFTTWNITVGAGGGGGADGGGNGGSGTASSITYASGVTLTAGGGKGGSGITGGAAGGAGGTRGGDGAYSSGEYDAAGGTGGSPNGGAGGAYSEDAEQGYAGSSGSHGIVTITW